MGKLEEIDLGPASTSRAEAAWKKMQGGAAGVQNQPAKVRLGRDGKPRRQPKRRNSEDIRRDAMVEAVLREAKCTFFPLPLPTSAPPLITSVQQWTISTLLLHPQTPMPTHRKPTTMKPLSNSFAWNFWTAYKSASSGNRRPLREARKKRPRARSWVVVVAQGQKCTRLRRRSRGRGHDVFCGICSR